MQAFGSVGHQLSVHPQRAFGRCGKQQAGIQTGSSSLSRRRDVQTHRATPKLCERVCEEKVQRLEEAFHLANPLPSLALLRVQLEPPRQTGGPRKDRSEDFYANLGFAIRVLRDEIPVLFQQDLTYDIYTEDIVFRDPRSAFRGKRNYRILFWSLRFHGRLFFRRLYVDVQRIWQPEEQQIRMRWTVHGIPRVPWNAEGIFDGVSTFRLDGHGKIYEHQVDNVILHDPPMLRSPLFAGLNLLPVAQPVQQPCPGAWFEDAPAPARQQVPAVPSACSSAPPLAAERGAGTPVLRAAEAAARPCDLLASISGVDGERGAGGAVTGGAESEGEEADCGRSGAESWLHLRAPPVQPLVHRVRSAASARGDDAVWWLHTLQESGLSAKQVAQPPYQAGAS